MPRNTYEMKRTNSICPKPEDQLLELVENSDVFKIRDLLKQNPNIVEKQYGSPHFKTILCIACSDVNVNAQTIEMLLSMGANPLTSCDMYQGKTAIHFATISNNVPALKTLIEHIKVTNPSDINITAEGDTALLSLVKESDEINKSGIDCANVLIRANIDVNKTDNKSLSAVLHAARKGFTEIIRVLIKESNVDLDSHYLRKKNARMIILEKKLLDENDLPLETEMLNQNNNEISNKEYVFQLLKSGNESQFLQISDSINQYINVDDGNETLLQICARLDLFRCAKMLVNLGADTNRITEKTTKTPLEITAGLGYFKTFNELVSHGQTKITNAVFTDLLRFIDHAQTQKMNHRKCFEALLDNRQIYNVLNSKNEYGNTPLHFAARYSDVNTTLLLLNKGASLADANNNGFLPIEDIEMDILLEHFNHCIKNVSYTNKLDDNDLTVIFDYKTILPSSAQRDFDNIVVHSNDYHNLKNKSDEQEQNSINQTNKENCKNQSEMEVIKYISKNKELRPLLLHPLITSFIYLKWHRISTLFYANLFLYVTTWFSLTTYIFMSYNNGNFENEKEGFKIFANILLVIIWISFFVLAIKESFQFIVSPLRYFAQMENYVEVILIISLILILFVKNPDDNFKKQIAAIAILVSAFQLVLLVGQHPKMSTSIVMLRTVSFSFFKFFLWYAILILAFALSFYTLFNDNSSEINTKNTNKTEGEESDAFNDPGVSLFKTFVMLTGEFDASDINFKTFPITSRILFVIFIFMIAIVLFNLLNGLAVSDTQLIKNNAELFAYTSRIDHICYVENMLLGNLASVPDFCAKFLHNVCCLFPFLNVTLTLPNRLAKRACLFPHYLCNLELEIYLNKDGKVKLPAEREKNCVKIDKKTVKNVRSLLKERGRINPNDIALEKLVNVVEEQQKRIDLLEVGQKNVLDKLNVILEKLETVT